MSLSSERTAWNFERSSSDSFGETFSRRDSMTFSRIALCFVGPLVETGSVIPNFLSIADFIMFDDLEK